MAPHRLVDLRGQHVHLAVLTELAPLPVLISGAGTGGRAHRVGPDPCAGGGPKEPRPGGTHERLPVTDFSEHVEDDPLAGCPWHGSPHRAGRTAPRAAYLQRVNIDVD